MTSTPLLDQAASPVASAQLSPDSSQDRRFALILTAIYAALVIWVAIHHEPWRDEADAWLAVRDMSLGQLFHWLGGAGSPGLWYLLLMPLAKLGLPYISMTLLHTGLAIAVAAMIAFRAPFPRLYRCLIIFSYHFVYEYAVISRSYVLTVLLLMLIAATLTARTWRPRILGTLLFLLFNTNAHGFFIAGVLSIVIAADLVWRRKLSKAVLIGAIIAAAGGLLAFLQLLPPSLAHPPNAFPHWPVAGDAISQAFFSRVPPYFGPFIKYAHGRIWAAEVMYYGIRGIGLFILLSILFLIRKSPVAAASLLLSSVALIYVFIFKWYGGERHAGLLQAMVIFALWVAGWPWSGRTAIAKPNRKTVFAKLSQIAFLASLCGSCIAGAIWSYRDIRWDYSGSKEAAQFIQSHSLTGLPIAAVPSPHAEALLPYLPGTRFWYIGPQDYGTYVRWDQDWSAEYLLSDNEVVTRIQKQFPDGRNLLLTGYKPLKNPQASGYKLIFQNSRYIFENPGNETFYLYAHVSTHN
jgi:hypothetical protein